MKYRKTKTKKEQIIEGESDVFGTSLVTGETYEVKPHTKQIINSRNTCNFNITGNDFTFGVSKTKLYNDFQEINRLKRNIILNSGNTQI